MNLDLQKSLFLLGFLAPSLGIKIQTYADELFFEVDDEARSIIYSTMEFDDLILPRLLYNSRYPFRGEFVATDFPHQCQDRLIKAFGHHPQTHPIIFPLLKVLSDEYLFNKIVELGEQYAPAPIQFLMVPDVRTKFNLLIPALKASVERNWCIFDRTDISLYPKEIQISLKSIYKFSPSDPILKHLELFDDDVNDTENYRHSWEELESYLQNQPATKSLYCLFKALFAQTNDLKNFAWYQHYKKIAKYLTKHLDDKKLLGLYHCRLFALISKILSVHSVIPSGENIIEAFSDLLIKNSAWDLPFYDFRRCISAFRMFGKRIMKLPISEKKLMEFDNLYSELHYVIGDVKLAIQYWRKLFSSTGKPLAPPTQISSWEQAYQFLGVPDLWINLIAPRKLAFPVIIGESLEKCNTFSCLLEHSTILYNNSFSVGKLPSEIQTDTELQAILRLMMSNLIYRETIGVNISEKFLHGLFFAEYEKLVEYDLELDFTQHFSLPALLALLEKQKEYK